MYKVVIVCKVFIFTSATKRRSRGALAKLAQIEEVKVTWLLAARTRFAIGKLNNSGIFNRTNVSIGTVPKVRVKEL